MRTPPRLPRPDSPHRNLRTPPVHRSKHPRSSRSYQRQNPLRCEADYHRLLLAVTRELVDVIFEQPYCRIANLVDKGVGQRQAASRYLKQRVGRSQVRQVPLPSSRRNR